MQESASNHDLTLLQQVMNAVGGLLLPYFYSQHFMAKRLSCRACSAQPAMCCQDNIQDARLGVNEDDTGEDNGSKKSELDNMHWVKLRDEIYEAWLIKRNLCVRVPWLARQGVHSLRLTYFIRTPKNSR